MNLPVVTLLLTLLDGTIIGRFEMNHEYRSWSFRYQKEFPQLDLLPLEAFPDIFKTYESEKCIMWLTQKIINIETDDKTFKVFESIKSSVNKDRYPLIITIMT